MMSFSNLAKWGVLMGLCLWVSACDVVKLDASGKPIIPMSAAEASAIKNMTPKALADKFWPSIIDEAKHKSIDIKALTTDNSGSLFVHLSGKIENVNEQSRAATITIAADSQHLVFQIGPIVRGNAIRDSASFIDFDQFKNQVQFARLSKALNQKAIHHFTRPAPDWAGSQVDVIAAVTVKNHAIQQAVPIEIVRR